MCDRLSRFIPLTITVSFLLLIVSGCITINNPPPVATTPPAPTVQATPATVVTSPAPAAAPTTENIWKNTKYKYSVKLPTDWIFDQKQMDSLKSTGGDAAYFCLAAYSNNKMNGYASCSITRQPTSFSDLAETYTTKLKDYFATKGTILSEQKNITCAGYPAIQQLYRYQQSGQQRLYYFVAFMHDDAMWAVDFDGPSIDGNIFDGIIKSFIFL